MKTAICLRVSSKRSLFVTQGREWGSDTAKEAVDQESTSLIHSAGAFVHGLEDEFLEVKNICLKIYYGVKK